MSSSAVQNAPSSPPPAIPRPVPVVTPPQTSPPSTISTEKKSKLSLSPTNRNRNENEKDSNEHHSAAYGCSFSRQWLIHVAQETLEIAQVGYYINQSGVKVNISESLKYSIENSMHYHSSHEFGAGSKGTTTGDAIGGTGAIADNSASTKRRQESYETEFHVCWGSSLQIASKLQEELETRFKVDTGAETSPSFASSTPLPSRYEIGILNSASGKYPDKFLRGTISQEEGICRASLLYPCLKQYKDRPHHFYYINSKPKYYESSSSCAIYCPKVPIIRQDDSIGRVLDNPKYFSIVNIPAPNAFVLGESLDNDAGEEDANNKPAVVPTAQKPGADLRHEPYEHMTIDAAMNDRIYRAISIFAENGCTDLVLCAFGCGVHGNNPQKIAKTFSNILQSNEFRGRFRIVAFAIQQSRHSNYEAFTKVFLGRKVDGG